MSEADPGAPVPVDAAPDLPPAAPRFIPWVTIVLAIACVAMFAWELAAGAHPMKPTADWMLAHGGNFGPVTHDGEPWRLFTSMFLHFGVLHLVMNLIGLVDGGRHVERMYGHAGFAVLYLLAGLAGSLATSLRANVVSAGASGAIFGVFGAFGAFLLVHRDRLDKQEVARQARGLLIFLGYNTLFGLGAEGIDLVAHFGGLVAGLLVGLALEYGTDHAPSTLRRAAVVAVLGLALVGAGTAVAPRPANAVQDLGKIERVVLARWNQAVGEIQAGTLTDAAAADVIERELLPPWREARAAYERDGAGKLYDAMVRYLRAREDGWTMMAKGLRAGDADAVTKGFARFGEADQVIAEIKAGAK